LANNENRVKYKWVLSAKSGHSTPIKKPAKGGLLNFYRKNLA